MEPGKLAPHDARVIGSQAPPEQLWPFARIQAIALQIAAHGPKGELRRNWSMPSRWDITCATAIVLHEATLGRELELFEVQRLADLLTSSAANSE